MEFMKKLWTAENQRSLESLKEVIMAGPKLARPDPSKSFYINTYWFTNVMGAVILKYEESVELIQEEAQEKAGGKFEFYNTI